MLHRLCGSPSIPLSFKLALVLPRRRTYRVSLGTERVETSNAECASFRAWTTGVSNPIRYPRFRASASNKAQLAAFAFGVPHDINAFHCYTMSSANLYLFLAQTFQMRPLSWAQWFNIWLFEPPTHPLRPMNPDNARGLRITAAAGTELATSYSTGTVIKVLPS